MNHLPNVATLIRMRYEVLRVADTVTVVLRHAAWHLLPGTRSLAPLDCIFPVRRATTVVGE